MSNGMNSKRNTPGPTPWPDTLSTDAVETLQAFRERLLSRSVDHLGYPYNFDHGNHLGPLHDLLRFSINNLGDPYDPSNYDVESRQFEVEVIDTYAKLWNIQKEEKYWGYVAHSGTEGNRLCMEIASRVFPEGIVYFSEASHYSIPGSATSFRLQRRCIPTIRTGEIDYEMLGEALREGKAANKPAIVCLNIGTTMTGAMDNVVTVSSLLVSAGYNLDTEVYIHLDGALSGLMVPFLEMEDDQRPDFRHKGVASYGCSGHKFLGCPMPAGIVVIRGRFVEKVHEHIEYLNSEVVTSMGSRNGHSPVFLWFELQRKGLSGLQGDTDRSMENAEYLRQLLVERRIGCFKNKYANTVVFERPVNDDFIKRFHLACSGALAHVVVMPSVERWKLLEFADAFASLLQQEKELQDGPAARPCVVEGCGEDAVCFCTKHYSGDSLSLEKGN